MNDENLLEAEIPEKFKDPQTGNVNVSMMAKSYKALEQRLSQVPAAPNSPEEYCISCKKGVLQADHNVNERLHAKGLTQEQAQEVYDIAEEYMIPLIQKIAADYKADREIDRLVTHFGGPEKWRVVARQLYAFGAKNLPENVLDNMASSYEGVLALYQMMKGDEPSLSKGMDPMMPEKAAQDELSTMMRDPRYWRDKDPSYIAKVTQGFQNLYS